MNRLACLATVVSVLALGASLAHAQQAAAPPAAGTPPPAAAAQTATFVPVAASANLLEIESSKLALQRGQSQAVKDFANQMIKDHTAAAAKMKQALAGKPMPPDQLDAKDQKVLDSLKGLHGAAFDRAYIEAQYKAHTEAVGLFSTYAQTGDDPKVKALAAELLPTLKSHLEHVSKMRSS